MRVSSLASRCVAFALVGLLLGACGATRHNGAGSRSPTSQPTLAGTRSRPVTKSETVAAINAACAEFYRFEPRDPGADATVAEMEQYARERIRSLDAGLRGAARAPLSASGRSVAELVHDNFSSAKSIYQQVAALPPRAPRASTALLMESAQRLVILAAVALIDYGATSCVPTAGAAAAPPGAGAGPLLAIAPDAVVKVADPLLDNKSIVADDRAIWVAVARAPSVVRIDPKTDAVVARVALSSQVTQPIQLIDGEIWVETLSDLVRVNEKTNRVDWQIALEGLTVTDSPFTVVGDVLWVCDRDVLHRVHVTDRSREGDLPLGGGCETLVASAGRVTASSFLSGTHPSTLIASLDARTGRQLAEMMLPALSTWGILATPDGRLFLDSGGLLRVLDVQTASTEHRAIRAGTAGNQVVVAAGALWVTRQDEQRVVRYDLSSGRLTEVRAGAGVNGIAVAGDSLWVTNSDAGTVMRFSIKKLSTAG